jgi:hypothetical protein
VIEPPDAVFVSTGGAGAENPKEFAARFMYAFRYRVLRESKSRSQISRGRSTASFTALFTPATAEGGRRLLIHLGSTDDPAGEIKERRPALCLLFTYGESRIFKTSSVATLLTTAVVVSIAGTMRPAMARTNKGSSEAAVELESGALLPEAAVVPPVDESGNA